MCRRGHLSVIREREACGWDCKWGKCCFIAEGHWCLSHTVLMGAEIGMIGFFIRQKQPNRTHYSISAQLPCSFVTSTWPM